MGELLSVRDRPGDNIGVELYPCRLPVSILNGAQAAQSCLQPCPACAQIGVRSGCNRESGHVGVHHCSNYQQGPHEW